MSVRIARDRILVTPSGANKGFVEPSDLVITDLDGRVVKGKARPSSEILVHLAAYRVRPDIRAVVHAHPPTAIAFTIAGISLAQCVIPESILTLGFVPTARYETPSTEALAAEVERLLVDHDVVMMDRHGSVTLGRDVFEAYDRLEALEHTAWITYLAKGLGPVRSLPGEEVERLRRLAAAMGRKVAFSGCEQCDVCPRGAHEVQEVVERVLAVLREGRTP